MLRISEYASKISQRCINERNIKYRPQDDTMKVITLKVPEWVSPEEAELWIAEGIGKKISRMLILEALSEGLQLEENEFEKTREEVWSEIKRKYIEMGLI